MWRFRFACLQALVVASGVGYYQNHPFSDGPVNTESSPPGTGFMSQLAKSWEDASRLPAGEPTRVVNVRSAVVLGKDGGAFAQARLPFSLVSMTSSKEEGGDSLAGSDRV